MKTVGKKRRALYLLIPFAVSLFIEALQYVLYLGAADITDLIMNTLGAIWGFACYAVAAYLFRKRREKLDLVLTVCISCLALFVFIIYIIGTNWAAYAEIFS